MEYYNGEIIYRLSAHPVHNKVQNNLYFQLRTLLSDAWEIYTSGVAVKFETEDEIYQFIPDLFAVRINKFNGGIYVGKPLLIIEVLSQDTESRDKGIKLDIYEKCGVNQYWIVDIDKQLITVYNCNIEGNFETKNTFIVESDFEFAGRKFDLAEVFKNTVRA